MRDQGETAVLISHRNKFIYTKTAKTASTSVESYFEMYCMPPGHWQFQHARDEYVSDTGVIGYRGKNGEQKQWFNHMAAINIRQRIGESVWQEYFKFAVIRDPFDKLVSGYFFAEKPTGSPDQLISGFREWVRNGGEIIDRHTYTIDSNICLDYFIRYEALADGVQHVCQVLQIPYEAQRLPTLKAGFRERDIPLAAFYDEATVKIVQHKYAFELDNFGYSAPV